MKDYKLHVSEGFKDTYGKELRVKKILEEKIYNTFRVFGYEMIKTPMLEYIDVYSQNGMQKPDLYNLINRQGEVLCLLNDMTPSIARFVASNKIDVTNPLKYSYMADTFRYPRLYQGKGHQFLQAGIELIAGDMYLLDLECIYIADTLMKVCNVVDYTIHLGSSKFINLLLKDYNISNSNSILINEAISNKDYVSLRNILNNLTTNEISNRIIDIILYGGRLSYINSLIEEFKDCNCVSELIYLKKLYEGLKKMGVGNIIFDFSIYSSLEYYTGIIFEVYANNITKSLLTGGRCDNMFDKYNLDYKDVGFGLDVDQLTLYSLINNTIDICEDKYLCYYEDDYYFKAVEYISNLRNNGNIVLLMKFNSIDLALDYAKNNNYNKLIIINNNIEVKEV